MNVYLKLLLLLFRLLQVLLSGGMTLLELVDLLSLLLADFNKLLILFLRSLNRLMHRGNECMCVHAYASAVMSYRIGSYTNCYAYKHQ